MPWKEVTRVSLRKEFVLLAFTEGVNISELCRRFCISRKTGYKWIRRYIHERDEGLADRSRRPKSSPNATDAKMTEAILHIRSLHPAWGGRKIRARLRSLGYHGVPAASTITAILKRHGRIDPEQSVKHKAFKRFEAAQPNDLWQMDFKGHFKAANGRCHPLTVLDDNSRYAVALQACENEQGDTVRQSLEGIFCRYGLPRSILVDNGSPWGSDKEHVYTPLTVWLIKMGITVIHSRPYHPQTLGKDERFHRTMKEEILFSCMGLAIGQCQRRFDKWRNIYNFQRPHESLDMAVPASRYQPSCRTYIDKMQEPLYSHEDQIRKVQHGGWISYRGKQFRVPKAFRGQYVAIRRTLTDGFFNVHFYNQRIAQINLNVRH